MDGGPNFNKLICHINVYFVLRKLIEFTIRGNKARKYASGEQTIKNALMGNELDFHL